MDITGIDKASILAALYNAARPLGMGFLHYTPEPMTREEASTLLESSSNKYFDYVKGRVMKINLSSDDFNTRLYNRDNGDGAAEKIIETLRITNDVSTPEIKEIHKEGVKQSAEEAKEGMKVDSGEEAPGVFRMGLADQKQTLEPAIKKALKDNE